METVIDGLWDFAFLGRMALETADPLGADFSEKMPVPGAFDALPKYAGKLGLAVYRKREISLEIAGEGCKITE